MYKRLTILNKSSHAVARGGRVFPPGQKVVIDYDVGSKRYIEIKACSFLKLLATQDVVFKKDQDTVEIAGLMLDPVVVQEGAVVPDRVTKDEASKAGKTLADHKVDDDVTAVEEAAVSEAGAALAEYDPAVEASAAGKVLADHKYDDDVTADEEVAASVAGATLSDYEPAKPVKRSKTTKPRKGGVRKQAKNVSCPFCDKQSSMSGIMGHVRLKHPEQYPEFKARVQKQ